MRPAPTAPVCRVRTAPAAWAGHHADVKGRNDRVSLAWLCAVSLGALGLLGTARVPEAGDALPDAVPLGLDYALAPGLGCSVVKELRFEMLPADAEPRIPPPRHARVCLALYQPPVEPGLD